MCAKLAAQASTFETFETPLKTPTHITTPTTSMALTPRKLPSTPSSQRYGCEFCRIDNTVDSFSSRYVSLFTFNDFSSQVNIKFQELKSQIEHISHKINAIEDTIFSYRRNISELERALTDITNKLNYVTPKYVSSSSPSSNANLNNENNQSSTKPSYVSFLHIKSISTSPPRPVVAKNPDNNRAYPPPLSASRPPPPHKCSLLVMGDSNTKHIKLHNISYHRIPTYLIENIDPHQCIGYAKVWLHVGINNLKSVRCGGPHDVRKYFELFINKIHEIKRLSPSTTIVISPILPTAVNVLNDRARAFNRLLFSTRRWWLELNFSLFASRNNMLENHYRCYGNPKDKIHLGFNGIRELERLITQKVSLVDARSYRAVVQSNIR